MACWEQVVSFKEWEEWTEVDTNVLIPNTNFDIVAEYIDLPNGARKCLDKDGSPVEPKEICDEIEDCRRGADEIDCPFFVHLKFWIPLVFTFALCFVGSLLWIALEYSCTGFLVK